MTLKLGGLFSGVGGFELAWTRLGGEVAWVCEYDKNARKVLEARFPGVPIYPDVRELDPAEVEAVDVLTGGSPCQGFSMAGTRSGLEHGESRLFADYVRIMEGLAQRGLKFALWENVPGVLSIRNDDGEMTFEHVVAALAGTNEPVRLDRNVRWNTGMVARQGRAVAWRVLDSRYFGVAQRRRRIFACVAFGDSCEDRAGRSLLAVSENVPRDSSPSEESRQRTSGNFAESVGASRQLAQLNNNMPDAMFFNEAGWAGYTQSNVAGTLRTVGPWTLTLVKKPETELMRKVRSGDFVSDNTSSTLAARDSKDFGDLVLEPTVCLQGSVQGRSDTAGPTGKGWKVEESFTLNTVDCHVVTDFTVVPLQDTRNIKKKQNGSGVGQPDDVSFTLDTASRAGVASSYGVRRLTAVECERLQSFPDGWTEPAGSDSARYKAMGNAITVNVVQWILGRMINNIGDNNGTHSFD